MEPPAAPEIRASDADPRSARRAARHTLRLLARLPLSPWRNTCLYRSIAECMILRRAGRSAVLELGVRREGEGPEDIAAHAWVELLSTQGEASPEGAEYHRLTRR